MPRWPYENSQFLSTIYGTFKLIVIFLIYTRMRIHSILLYIISTRYMTNIFIIYDTKHRSYEPNIYTIVVISEYNNCRWGWTGNQLPSPTKTGYIVRDIYIYLMKLLYTFENYVSHVTWLRTLNRWLDNPWSSTNVVSEY